MKRIIFSLLTAAICNASSLFAQQTEKTITIQTNGQEDVIDLPEGMITTTDSLYLVDFQALHQSCRKLYDDYPKSGSQRFYLHGPLAAYSGYYRNAL